MRSLAPAAYRPNAKPFLLRSAPLASGRELILLATLIAVYALWYSDDPRTDFRSLNTGGPAALMAILFLGAWQQIRINPRSIWAPLLWFRISSAVYFGLGSMVPYIGNDATAAMMRATYDFSEREAFKAGLINVLCIFTVLLTTAVISSNWRDRPPQPARARESNSLALYFAIAMLLVGGYIRYVVLLPIAFGMASFIPQSIGSVGNSYPIGLYLLILYGLRTSRLVLFIAGVLVLVDLFAALLTFSKMNVLFTLFFVYLAILHHRLTLKRMLIGVLLMAGTYSQIAPIVGYGREELARVNQTPLVGTFDQRLAILTSYAGIGQQAGNAEDASALVRFCYLDYAALVVSWYDQGSPGNSLDNLLYTLIPRFIWPDKPIISSVGSDLFFRATGAEGNSNSAGVFAEAYWNFGWAGIPEVMVPYALILAYLSRYCLRMMTSERWMHLPAVLLAVSMGLRTDGVLIVDVFGAGVIVFAFILICGVLEKVSLPNSVRR